MFKKICITAILFTGMINYGCAPRNIVIGDGMPMTETRSISTTVDDVRLNLPGTLRITFGQNTSLRITADQNIIPLINSNLVGEALVIDNAAGNSFQANSPIMYELTLREFDNLVINGSADAIIGSIDEAEFDITINGSGNVTLCGQAVQYSVNINGSGDLNALALPANIATVNIIGAGNVKANVSNELEIRITGSGNVEYSGTPEIDDQVTGAGVIRNIDPPGEDEDPCMLGDMTQMSTETSGG